MVVQRHVSWPSCGQGTPEVKSFPRQSTQSNSRAWPSYFVRTQDGKVSTPSAFLAGLMSGVTEAVLIVTPFGTVLRTFNISLEVPHKQPIAQSEPSPA